MTPKTYFHDPENNTPYGFDLQHWLLPGEVLNGMTVSVTPPGIIETDNPVVDPRRMLVWCRAATGVTTGTALVTLHITSNLGREEDWSFYLYLKQR